MRNIYYSNTEYNDLMNRIKKEFLFLDGIYITVKLHFTNNIFYYFLCLFFRFVPLMELSGHYFTIFEKKNKSKSFLNFLRYFTIYKYGSQITISYNNYIAINILIYLLFTIRQIFIFNLLQELKNFHHSNKWPMAGKYLIILDHILFLLFPFLIEFLSFSYYILAFPDRFIIKINDTSDYISLYIIIIINTILIIIYTICNYIYFMCINKVFTTTYFEAYSNIISQNSILRKKPISYRASKISIFVLTFMQNFALITTLEHFLHKGIIIVFKIMVSILLIFLILILFFSRINNYNYSNTINILLNVFCLYCFYSIIFDLILYIASYEINSLIFEIIYIIMKFTISYITFSLFVLKIHKYFQSKIIEILFQIKKNEKEGKILNAFYYLHEIMLKIKEDNDINSVYLIINFLNDHIIKCNKIECNCRLLLNIINKENFKIKNKEILKSYITDLLNNLNYLFESSFVEIDYYNNWELTILLAEHFCHLKVNPMMSFSFITTLMIKNRNNLSRFQMIILYELSQKYIYYSSALTKKEKDNKLTEKRIKSGLNREKEDNLKLYFNYSNISIKIKMHIKDYIDNHIKILKYKNLFEESIKFDFDEANEIISNVKIKFFDSVSVIDSDLNIYNKKNKKKFSSLNKKKNLYKIIYLLKNEILYYNNIINCIDNINSTKNMPIFIIFKYYLFFDIFNGGKIPHHIADKLYKNLTKKMNFYNNYITFNEYSLLKKLYNDQNNNINSKYYSMFEYKNDLRTKYFSESISLKLGYTQKDIINKKLDQLMPKKFYESHQSMLKHLILYEQRKYFNNHESYLFDFTSNILYPVNQESLLIPNISKNLIIISQSSFLIDNEYKFMLNNNFELMANSKNFEDEYYFNKKIFERYDIKLLDILQMKSSKIYKIFDDTFKKIDEQRLIRKIKTEEYFIPKFYSSPGDKIIGMVNSNYFNATKKNFIMKISNLKAKNDNVYENIEDEKNNLINNNKSKVFIDNSFFINPGEIIFHDNFNFILSKTRFIESLSKELTKIPDNDLMFENDKYNYNLIISGKQLISKLLKKRNNLLNNVVKVKIRLSYYYDEPFYFISIDDEKKIFVKISKLFNENNSTNNDNKSKQLQNLSMGKKTKANNNKILNEEKNLFKNRDLILNKSDIDVVIDKIEIEKNKIINKIEKCRNEINKDKFIFVIKIILSIIIILIFLIYILIIIFQKIFVYRLQIILLAYYYNIQTENSLLHIHSLLLEIYYDKSNLTNIHASDYEQKQNILNLYSDLYKDNIYQFTKYYFDFIIEVKNNNFNWIYNSKKFYKIEGFWEESEFDSNILAELEMILYNIYSINTTIIDSGKIDNDLNNFLFFSNKRDSFIKVDSIFIKLLYYLCANYEFILKNLFIEFRDSMYISFNEYANMNYYFLLEFFGLIFYIILFFSVIIYLYYSNQIILKNIIFLFLDFSEDHYDKNLLNINNKIILKLLELNNLINDFNLEQLQKYSKNINNLNRTKQINDKNNSEIVFSDIVNYKNFNKVEAKKHQSQNQVNNINSFLLNKAGRSSLNKSSSKNIMLNNKKEKEKEIQRINSKKFIMKTKSITNSDFKSNHLADFKNKPLNDSSQAYLMENNASFLKDKLSDDNQKETNINRKSMPNQNNKNEMELNISNDKNKKSNNYVNSYIFRTKKNNTLKNEENEFNESYQDILLNKSNKTQIFIIKVYTIIIILLIVLITGFSIFKIKLTLDFKSLLNYYFKDYISITNRYELLIYNFNILRTLLIFPDDTRKKTFEKIIKNINNEYNRQNELYIDILSYRIKKYKETNKLIEIFQEKSNKTEILKNAICKKNKICLDNLESKNNLDSGVDFTYKAFINQINNIFLDYDKLLNKTNIENIDKILKFKNSQFEIISQSVNIIFFFSQYAIFEAFYNDQLNFKNEYSNNITFLNIISVIFSILNFLFINIIIFFSISSFSKPIKNSTFRINRSFYFIKKYNIANKLE